MPVLWNYEKYKEFGLHERDKTRNGLRGKEISSGHRSFNVLIKPLTKQPTEEKPKKPKHQKGPLCGK